MECFRDRTEPSQGSKGENSTVIWVCQIHKSRCKARRGCFYGLVLWSLNQNHTVCNYRCSLGPRGEAFRRQVVKHLEEGGQVGHRGWDTAVTCVRLEAQPFALGTSLSELVSLSLSLCLSVSVSLSLSLCLSVFQSLSLCLCLSVF